MQNDVLPIHGRPLHPQTQGKEERFHRTMKTELLKRSVIANLQNAQELFDPWRYEYNHERPHEALNLDVPAKHYKNSQKVFNDTVCEPEYNSGARLRKVNCKGYLSIRNHRYFISDSFIGKYLEIRDVDKDCISLNYGDFQVAKTNLNEQILVSRRIVRVPRR